MGYLPDQFALRFVIYPNPDDPQHWAAHSLEMDLMGFGDTVQEALEELLQAIDGQFRHAGSKGQIFFPAAPEVWQILSKSRPLPPGIMERAFKSVFGKPTRLRTRTPAPPQVWASEGSLRRIKMESACV
jgi:predicted RNase H-like HicB family nuclease